MLNLQPTNVFKYFEQISQIPRGSGDEKRISDYLVSVAKSHELEFTQDNALNVIIKKPATAGYEHLPTVILQGHMDMVCEKNKATVHDFTVDPLTLIVEGDFLLANETTLGADNGIAVAYGLALLDDESISHPPLELLFTSNEETGMDGARAIDQRHLNGKCIINIDSEDEGIFLSGCAGGLRACISLDVEYTNQQFASTFELSVRGLKGGHSGTEIDKHRANANVLMGRILSRLLEASPVCLAAINGGAKDNAIPREADIILCTDTSFESCNAIITEVQQIFSNEYKSSDSEIKLTLSPIDFTGEHYTNDVTRKIVDILTLIPNGIQEMSSNIDGLVETSLNLGVITSDSEKVTFATAIRSSIASRKYELLNRISHLCKLTGAALSTHGDYPGWEYSENSRLRELFLSEYNKLFHKDGQLSAIHAGLECGLLLEKIPGADVISFGPNMYDVHTPDEHVSISSVERNWKLLLNVLAAMK